LKAIGLSSISFFTENLLVTKPTSVGPIILSDGKTKIRNKKTITVIKYKPTILHLLNLLI